MDDNVILELYWSRNQDAITATSEKYGRYCCSIARNILVSREDAEECVNDTWLNAWNAIPPHRPALFSAFLGKITRNLAFNRYKRLHADKRGDGVMPLILEELEECVSGGDSVEQEIQSRELAREIDCFLGKLPPQTRKIFVRRYWYCDSMETISGRENRSVGSITMLLSRTRKQLKDYLSERGYSL